MWRQQPKKKRFCSPIRWQFHNIHKHKVLLHEVAKERAASGCAFRINSRTNDQEPHILIKLNPQCFFSTVVNWYHRWTTPEFSYNCNPTSRYWKGKRRTLRIWITYKVKETYSRVLLHDSPNAAASVQAKIEGSLAPHGNWYTTMLHE